MTGQKMQARLDDEIELGDGQATLRVTALQDLIVTGGIPMIDQVRLPMANLDLAWYEYATLVGSYNYHPPCRDWNLETMGNTDLGEPLVAPFNGLVLSSYQWGGGIGRVVQIVGRTTDNLLVVWSGWHLHSMEVGTGDIVMMGQAIGSIGNADGRYSGAHLHEQICWVGSRGIPTPNTFGSDSRYSWMDTVEFYTIMGLGPDLLDRVTRKDSR